jgi:hypothetical protein
MSLGMVAALFCFASAAHANPKDYCEAYARDFADQVQADKAAWENRRVNALRDCLSQYQSQSSTPAKKQTASAPAETPAAPDEPPAASDAAAADETQNADVAASPPKVAKKSAKKTRVTKAAAKQAAPVVPDDVPDSIYSEPGSQDVLVVPDIPPPGGGQAAAVPPATPVVKQKSTLLSKLLGKKDQIIQAVKPSGRALTNKERLTPGSAAWVDYCSRKYASFDPATGTYKSYKGAERKCLVTNR